MDGLGPMLMSMATKGGGGGDGLFGGGGGGGLIGGLILGSLLRNNGNLFGGDGNGGAVAGAVLRNPPEQNQANMDLMASIGQVDKAVAVSTAAMEASQAAQSSTLQAQMSSIASATVGQIAGVKDLVNSNSVALMQMLNATNTNISNDGEKTRALIVSQYEQTLNRQLSDANAAIIELRSDNLAARRAHDNEINVTQTVNQAQAQTQQQQQWSNLYNMLGDAVQSIRATNQAINIGAGTLTANPTNTNTNTRVN
jgi:hypothetical protein